MSHDESMSDTNGSPLPIDPELLSAFYDAETTADERARVEQHLDDATGTLQTLDEFDHLSQSLNDLHRAVPSPDLRDDVLASVSSAGTSAEPASPARASVADSSVKRPRRRMLQIAAGLAGLAAAVTLLLWPQGEVPPGEALAINDGEAVNGTAVMESDLALPAEGGAMSVTNHEATAESLAKEADKTLSFQSADSKPSADDVAARHAEMEANIAQASGGSSLAEIANERPLPQVGEVLGYLDRNADELTWVAVTVVDVQKAGDQVQLLLSQNGVEAPSETAASAEGSQQPNERMTFVVEAEWNQMEAVIVGLSDSSLIRTVEVDAPADEGVPTELQNYATNRYDEYDLAGTNEPAVQLRQRVQDRTGLSTARGAAGRKLTPQSGRRPAAAVQLQANMSEKDLQRIAKKRSADKRSASVDRLGTAFSTAQPAPIAALSAAPRAKVLIILQAE